MSLALNFPNYSTFFRIEDDVMFRKLIVSWFALFLVSLTTSPVRAAVIHNGKVTAVGSWQISVQDASGDIDQFDVDSEARIMHNGKPAMLGAIDSGDVVKLTLKTKRGQLLVVEIDARDRE
jgi:Cu/Ag efflux protein CusF